MTEITQIKITGDAAMFEKLFNYNNDVTLILQSNYNKIMESKKPTKMVEKLLNDIAQYPRVPQFKNQLQITYIKIGREDKAIEMLDYILAEHPDYLFARLNKAHRHYDNEEYDKMLPLLGEALDLQKLYPNRNEFHQDEVMKYMSAVVLYLNATQHDYEDIQRRLDLMNKISPANEIINSTEQMMFSLNLQRSKKRMKENEKFIRKPETFFEQTVPKLNKVPVLSNQLMNKLYDSSTIFEDDFLKQLHQISTESIIADAEKIIDDSIARFSYLKKNPQIKNDFLIHNAVVLSDTNHPSSIHLLLKCISNAEDYIEFYWGDFLNEDFWQMLYSQSSGKLDVLFDYLYKSNQFTFSRIAVLECIAQIGFHQPELKNNIENFYENFYRYALANINDNGFMDTVVNASMAADIVDLKMEKLYPLIKEMYAVDLIDLLMVGKFEQLTKEYDGDDSHKKRELKNTQQIIDSLLNFEAEEDDFIDYKMEKLVPITSTKIGRNEPCICGSGNKYKRCCGINE